MNENIKQKFEEISNYLASLDKLIDDVKWMSGGFTAISITLFSILSLTFSWNFNQDKISLSELKKDIKLEFENKNNSKIEIFSVDNKPLNNQKIPISIEKETIKEKFIGRYFIYIHHAVKNTGTDSTGPIFIKLYTKKPIELENPSIDESDFQFEQYIAPENLNPSEIPGQYMTSYFTKVYLKSNVEPNPEMATIEHEILIKYYYGKGDVSSAKFIGLIKTTKKDEKIPLETGESKQGF